jgi:hypothetical protein
MLPTRSLTRFTPPGDTSRYFILRVHSMAQASQATACFASAARFAQLCSGKETGRGSRRQVARSSTWAAPAPYLRYTITAVLLLQTSRKLKLHDIVTTSRISNGCSIHLALIHGNFFRHTVKDVLRTLAGARGQLHSLQHRGGGISCPCHQVTFRLSVQP